MKKQKSNKGITLVALVITIIVLLVLAVVSIRLVLNEGILTKADEGVTAYSDAEIEERIQVAYSEYQMNKIANPNATFEQALQQAGIAYDSVSGSDASGYVVAVQTKEGQKLFKAKNGVEKLRIQNRGLCKL